MTGANGDPTEGTSRTLTVGPSWVSMGVLLGVPRCVPLRVPPLHWCLNKVTPRGPNGYLTGTAIRLRVHTSEYVMELLQTIKSNYKSFLYF